MQAVSLQWEKFKLLIDETLPGDRENGLPFYVFDGDSVYQIGASDGAFNYQCAISKTDPGESFSKQEFEAKYRAKATTYDRTNIESANSILAALKIIGDRLLPAESPAKEEVREPASYSAAVASFSVASSATDIFAITGSDKKVVKVRRIDVCLTANIALGASVTVELLAIKRSTKNSGGTSTVLNPTPHDALHPMAEASVRYYTANPTLGTAVGTVRARKLTVQSINTANAAVCVEWVFDKPIVLRSSIESLAVNLNGNTITSDLESINVEWEEV